MTERQTDRQTDQSLSRPAGQSSCIISRRSLLSLKLAQLRTHFAAPIVARAESALQHAASSADGLRGVARHRIFLHSRPTPVSAHQLIYLASPFSPHRFLVVRQPPATACSERGAVADRYRLYYKLCKLCGEKPVVEKRSSIGLAHNEVGRRRCADLTMKH